MNDSHYFVQRMQAIAGIELKKKDNESASELFSMTQFSMDLSLRTRHWEEVTSESFLPNRWLGYMRSLRVQPTGLRKSEMIVQFRM